MEAKMTREHIVQELEDLFPDKENRLWYLQLYTIADYILSRERLLLEKIGKVLREFKANTIADYEKTYGCDPLEWGICDGEKAIDEALAIIEKESEQ
jgi:hypothetical protein